MLYSVNKNDNNADNFTDPHNAYTFSGTQFDEETSLNYYGSRYYDSWNGTWSTQDIYRGVIEDPMSLHRSAFVKNNPINFIDPDGYSWLQVASTYVPVVKTLVDYAKEEGINIDVNKEYSNYNFETGKLEKATLDLNVKIGQESSLSLDAYHAWRQGQDHGVTMLEVDAFMALDEQDKIAYMAALNLYSETNGVPTADVYMHAGNENGWKMSGNISAEHLRQVFELEKKAKIQAFEKGLKKETDQIIVQSMIKQANIAADPWIDMMKLLFAGNDVANLSLAEMDDLFLKCGSNQACINYVMHSQINPEGVKKLLIGGGEFTVLSDGSVIF